MKKSKSKFFKNIKFISIIFLLLSTFLIQSKVLTDISYADNIIKRENSSDNFFDKLKEWGRGLLKEFVLEDVYAEDNYANKLDILLVNKDNPIDDDYVPNDLVLVTKKYSSGTYYLQSQAAKAYEKLAKAAKKNNIKIKIVSGYRSYETQSVIYDTEIETNGYEYANLYVAYPGASEHQTGLAIDVGSDEYSGLDEYFADTEAYSWLIDNMSKYGFILRYPEDKTHITGYAYEPWHIRYVGKEAATYIMEHNITLEEYFEK